MYVCVCVCVCVYTHTYSNTTASTNKWCVCLGDVQSKGMTNADLMLEWIKHMYTPSKYPLFPRHSTIRPPRLLSLDVFSGQKTKEVITSFKALKCMTLFIPGSTTGFIQVCDTVINKSLKARIKELAD